MRVEDGQSRHLQRPLTSGQQQPTPFRPISLCLAPPKADIILMLVSFFEFKEHP